MKRILSLTLVLFCGAIAIWGAINDRPIRFQQLPKEAQTFVKKHFNNVRVVYTTVDNDLTKKTYEVRLANGVEIEFNSKGQWKDIDGNRNNLPISVVPAAVLKTIRAEHATDQVQQIERKRYGYEVKLSSGLELKLDKNGTIVGYDD